GFVRANLLLGLTALGGVYLAMHAPSSPMSLEIWGNRTYELTALALFAIAAIFLLPRFYQRNPSLVSHAFLLSMLPNMGAQALMFFGSVEAFDGPFLYAHLLKIFAYLLPLGGMSL